MKDISNTKKIAIFSDIHFGKTRDSIIKLNTSIAFVDWFIDKCKENSIDLVIVAGDIFDNRNAISIITHDIVYLCIKKIAEQFPVFIIVGNHDTTLKATTDINSLKHFDEIYNVKIIEKTHELEINGRSILMFPWNGQFVEDKTYDFMFGHFEFNGAAMVGCTFENAALSMQELVRRSSLVFSGHFHIRKEYPQETGKIITIGSPFELDWGDIDNTKGFYILDISNRTYEFVENTISPKHYKYYWSKLKNKTQVLSKKEIEGNYIKIVIDDEYNFETIVKLMEEINLRKPLKPCESEFIYSYNNNLLETELQNDIEIHMTKFEYVKKFIDLMPDELFKANPDITKEKLAEMAYQYYCNAESVGFKDAE